MLIAAGVLLAAAAVVPAFCALDALCPFPAARLTEAQSGGSALVLDRNGGLISWRVDSAESWRLPMRLDRISPWVVKATVAAEDKRFWQHGGVDPLAAARALRQNLTNGRRVSGASTITMQCVRLIWPRPRTYVSKCIEAFRAVQLERIATKDEIIELYLNVAPYGGNVVGIGAAARRYFGKGAADLSLAEAALLAGIPQRPARFNPRKHLGRALARRDFVLARMQALGLATEGQINATEHEPVVLCPATSRTEAPSFADYVIARAIKSGGIRTTIDPDVQTATTGSVLERAVELKSMGIDGVAAVVIGVQDSELLAMVGTADRLDPQTGWINGATALRQPGSLLKPFIYASAFEVGVLTPRSVVYDIPSSWGDYGPKNMDREFLGPVSAATALSRSRNVPAVRLLDTLGLKRLAADLNRMGLRVPNAGERCGLSLALGTAEVRLVDVANAYAALARLGRYRPLRILVDEPGGRTGRVYSAGAAYLTIRSLGSPNGGPATSMACKTGTSWNHRDAWAVVITPAHVVAAWCGRHSGRGHTALVGADVALPLAAEIADRISSGKNEAWAKPPGVRTRLACSVSGAPVSAACPSTVAAEYLPGVSSEIPCRIHRFAVRRGVRQVVTVWPAPAANHLASQTQTQNVAQRPRVEIVSPANGGEYVLPSGSGIASRTLELSASVPRSLSVVYWYLNGELLSRASAGEPVRWPMRPGRHELIACDENGASGAVTFSVIAAHTARGRH